MRKVNKSGSASLSYDDFVVLFGSGGLDDALVAEVLARKKKQYVDEKHKYKISQMHSTTYKNGWWKTYVTGSDGKRKEVVRKTEDEIYCALYDFYTNAELITLADAFDLLRQYKTEELNRTYHTVYEEDTRNFAFLSTTLQQTPIKEISESDIRQWIVKEFLPSEHTKRDLDRVLQILNQTFEHSIDLGKCNTNPVSRIKPTPYLKDCKQSGRYDEQKEFSLSERDILRADAIQKADNPRALMLLFASYTGLRAGEMPPIRWSDISEDEIHVHRQQVCDRSSGHQQFLEVNYTKNERTMPHDGRKVVITPEVNTILELAKNLSGESEYVFHDKTGKPISRDSYMLFLRRTCQRHGIETTHNHAFRVARNSDLYEKSLTAPERATYLGHSPETNQRAYSPTNRCKQESIKRKLA